jgi:predicted DCC family thiol-disulfide oxidoreductase YuxK
LAASEGPVDAFQIRRLVQHQMPGLHAVDAEERLFVGADCAVEIWLRTPGDTSPGRLLSLPVVRQIARFAYDRFADLLYAWNRRKGLRLEPPQRPLVGPVALAEQRSGPLS